MPIDYDKHVAQAEDEIAKLYDREINNLVRCFSARAMLFSYGHAISDSQEICEQEHQLTELQEELKLFKRAVSYFKSNSDASSYEDSDFKCHIDRHDMERSFKYLTDFVAELGVDADFGAESRGRRKR